MHSPRHVKVVTRQRYHSHWCSAVQVYGLSGPVARYIGRNGPILHRFANEDVTLGAWLVGLEVTHVDERRFCCDSAERCMAQVRPGLCLCMTENFVMVT